MSNLSSQDMAKLQSYLQKKLGNAHLAVRSRGKVSDSAEVLLNGEFIGTIYKDVDDGETSFDFNMAILDIDLAEKAG